MSPAACPECQHYEYLTKPDVAESFRDGNATYRDIVCENCGWVGEADYLDEMDSGD
jgi:hypothetical protein